MTRPGRLSSADHSPRVPFRPHPTPPHRSAAIDKDLGMSTISTNLRAPLAALMTPQVSAPKNEPPRRTPTSLPSLTDLTDLTMPRWSEFPQPPRSALTRPTRPSRSLVSRPRPVAARRASTRLAKRPPRPRRGTTPSRRRPKPAARCRSWGCFGCRGCRCRADQRRAAAPRSCRRPPRAPPRVGRR